jgi:hypothetical protein
MTNEESRGDGGLVDQAPHFVEETGVEPAQPWEEIESGRFMPRRIRGSYKGRALG